MADGLKEGRRSMFGLVVVEEEGLDGDGRLCTGEDEGKMEEGEEDDDDDDDEEEEEED
jgi:hypothetical protein